MDDVESGPATDGEALEGASAVVVSPLRPIEILAAQYTVTHALHGAFYADLPALPLHSLAEHPLMSDSPKVSTPFDQGTPPALALDHGTTKLTFVYEFGGYLANYDAQGNPAYRYQLRDASGADTIVGPVIDVPAFNAYCDANGIPREPSIQAPPVPVVLSSTDAAAVQAHPAVAATPASPATHAVVPVEQVSFWQKLEAKVRELGHDVEAWVK